MTTDTMTRQAGNPDTGLHPIARSGGVQPVGFYVNLFLLAVLILGFALSLARSTARK
jgi:hypothetical protein